MATETKKTTWGMYAFLGLIAGVVACVVYKYRATIMPGIASSTTTATATATAPPTATTPSVSHNATGLTGMTAAEQSWHCTNHPNAPGCDKIKKQLAINAPGTASMQSWNCTNHPNAPGCDQIKTNTLSVNRATNWVG